MNFKNKVVWITGASSGIGEHLAYEFDKLGASIILSARREDALQQVKDKLKNESKIVLLDVSDLDQIPMKTAAAIGAFGHIDILINNAGISQRGSVEDTVLAVDKRIFDVNFFGNIALTKALLPHLLAQKSGNIVPISSVAGKMSTPGRSSYAASKHALHGWYDALRAEVADRNVHVNIICPGYIRTDISVNALSADGTKHSVMDPNQASGMPANKCAQLIINAIASNKRESYLGKEKKYILLRKLFPSIYYKTIEKMAREKRY
jgi:short-subunit dehydrogenase